MGGLRGHKDYPTACGLRSQGGFLVRSLSPLVFKQQLAPVTPVLTFFFSPSLPGALVFLSPVCVMPQPPQQSLTMALLGPEDKSYTSWESEMGFGGDMFLRRFKAGKACVRHGRCSKFLDTEELAGSWPKEVATKEWLGYLPTLPRRPALPEEEAFSRTKGCSLAFTSGEQALGSLWVTSLFPEFSHRRRSSLHLPACAGTVDPRLTMS